MNAICWFPNLEQSTTRASGSGLDFRPFQTKTYDPSAYWCDEILPPVEFYLYPTVGTVSIHSVKPELTE